MTKEIDFIINIPHYEVEDGKVEMADEEVSCTLLNVSNGSQVFCMKRIKHNPHNKDTITDQPVTVDSRNVYITKFCDYLVFLKRKKRLSPILFELARTGTSPMLCRKSEQLFCSLPPMSYLHSIHSSTLDRSTIMEEPRLVILHKFSNERQPQGKIYPTKLHEHRPRLVSPAEHGSSVFEVNHYGGANNMVRIAKVILGSRTTLDAREIFKALPDARMNQEEAMGYQSVYKKLVKRTGR